MSPAQFRAHLLERIAEKGLTAYAKEVGVDPRGLQLIARGDNRPSDKTLAKLGFRLVVTERYERT